MATATKYLVTPGCGLSLGTLASPDAAQKATDVLQENMEKHHMMWLTNRHNHVSHHVLTALDLGASASDIEAMYQRDLQTLEPIPQANMDDIRSMENERDFVRLLDNLDNYSSFLAYFQRQIDANGIGKVVLEHVFDRNEKAAAILPRFFSSKFSTGFPKSNWMTDSGC
ncbi:hypothetical protein LTR93_012068 [Exophiala xenobiotica]|nr:hypothetical protein LTR93_012068 [Exophiala xenobiotica]